MTVYELYDEMLKDDKNHEKFKSLLDSAEEKLHDGALKAYEYCALIDAMNRFPSNWDVPLDFWNIDQWEEVEDTEKLDYYLGELSHEEICTEYVTRKLCCLFDTNAPRAEIEKWLELCEDWVSDYLRFSAGPLFYVMNKLLDWYKTN